MVWCEQRERAFEYEFARKAEIEFAATVRCHQLLGRWAARQMHMTREEALGYCGELTRFSLTHPDERAFLERLRDDLRRLNIDVSEADLVSRSHRVRTRIEAIKNNPHWTRPH